MLDKQILRIGDIHQVRTHFLLCDGIGCDIRHIIFLVQPERIPNLPVLAVAVRHHFAAHRQQFFPLLFAHFLLLHRTPVDTLSVQSAITGDRYVLQLRSVHARMTFLTAVPQRVVLLHVQFLVIGEEDCSLVFQVQVEVTDHLDRARQPCAIRHDQVTTALFLQVFECLRKRFRAIRLSITYRTEIGQIHRIVRNNDLFHLLYRTRQIGIIMRVLRLRHSRYAHQRQHRKNQFFHICFIRVQFSRTNLVPNYLNRLPNWYIVYPMCTV